ncbi:hypothetical protein RR46_01353 [Papilio xuthus]|uniref:Ig-like domain-containing protein n=1 Tax=Papilio xuthus TaxID=66420 RepID=A0A0N0P9R8_PAPXU|nr:hypothetical protein RR46_01353 [Papilio xuthus]
MEEKETAVEDGNLTIYYVQQSDRGVYQCNVGSIVSSLVVLQVLDDDDKYNVVSEAANISRSIPLSPCTPKPQATGLHQMVCMERLQPVRSGRSAETLWLLLRAVPCKSDIFEVRASSGEVLERANNSEGVFSLCQREPPQPPPPSRDMHFAPRGAAVLLKCPGSALEDRPVTWWIGNREVVPRELDISTAGRMHLNARDHIVIVSAEYTDSNVYSCWEGEKLSGVIKLKLFSESREKCGGRVTQLGVVCGLALLHRALHHLHLCLTRVTPRTPLTPSHAR